MANMAIHWNVHLMNIFDKVLAEYWQEWHTLYVDDLGVHGATKLRVETRARVLEAILTAMEKPFSDKTGNDVRTSLDIAGMHIT